MAKARHLIEGVDDPGSFDVKGHVESPVARLALTNGFKRDDRNPAEERYTKKLSNGDEAWLRTHPHSEYMPEKPLDMLDATSGRHWEFVVFKPKTHTFKQLASGSETTMNYLLGALLQRLATWNPRVPKPTLEARKSVPVPDPDDPVANVERYVTDKTPYFPDYTKLARLLAEHPEIYIQGRVVRTDHHYVHQHSTDFSLEMHDMPEEVDTEETGKLANAVEALIQEECVRINHKIYKALEREWDYLNSDEAVDEMMEANLYTFDEDGAQGGDIPFAQLDDDAKEAARDWYREAGFQHEWWDHIYEEWTEELKEMGFDGIDISFSGFASQGDGASFTATSFDFLKWANWHMSNKPTEKGHPYTDDLFRTESVQEAYNFPDYGEQEKPEHWELPEPPPPDPDDPQVFIQREIERRSEPIKKLEVLGRRWFRRGAGGVYCKAYIYINDKLVHTTPEQYGYGDHYLTLAKDWLMREGYLAGLLDNERDPLWYLRDKHGIDMQYSVADVPRERDL